MKIEEFKSTRIGDRKRVSAIISWENCDRLAHELYFETHEDFVEELSCDPHAFLVACAIPAMHYGEERVFIDAQVCPELLDGLMTSMAWLRHWYGPDRDLPCIESRTPARMSIPRTTECAALFLSGGVDSLATLRTNRQHFPLDHPRSMKEALIVYGLELDDPEVFEYVMEPLSYIAQDAGLRLIPVYTNLYLQYRNEDAANGFHFWWYKFMGAALAAVAHAFAQRLTTVTIASDYDIPHQRPHGSHPILDPNYSSSDLSIRHDGITLSRFAKTKLIADWEVARQYLRVCNRYRLYQSGALNCGRCEKCIRTMLALLALGKLDQTHAFSKKNISEELLQSVLKLKYTSLPFYEELIEPLKIKGHHNLARVIEKKIDQYNTSQKKNRLREMTKRIDNKYFNSKLLKFKKKWVYA